MHYANTTAYHKNTEKNKLKLTTLPRARTLRKVEERLEEDDLSSTSSSASTAAACFIDSDSSASSSIASIITKLFFYFCRDSYWNFKNEIKLEIQIIKTFTFFSNKMKNVSEIESGEKSLFSVGSNIIIIKCNCLSLSRF